MNPDRYRAPHRGKIASAPAFAAGYCVLAAGTLAGALLICSPGHAQTEDLIENRIESTFGLVLGNPAELAVPLTRRALARRSKEREQGIQPLSYAAETPRETPAAASEPLSAPVAEEVEQGSAEDDGELARLPRPRPVVITEATGTSDLIGQPLDLVAGAAAVAPLSGAARGSTLEPEAVALAAGSGTDEPLGEQAEATALIPPAPEQSQPAELVAAGSCLSVGDVTDRDGDFKRNAEALSAAGLCIAQEEFRERRRSWIIQTVKSLKPGPLWALMHDDEDMSFDNAVAALSKFGGTLVAVEAGGKRNLSGIDPNRNFSADGIGCRKLGDNAAPRFTGFFSDLIDPTQPIVALHNNSKDRIPSGGLGHVSMDLVPRGMRSRPAPESDGSLAGNHALVLLAVSDLDDPTAEGRAAVLNKEGINVVLERVREDRGDCSLSNYAVLLDNPNYFNITVHEDEREKQMGIIDVLMSGRSETVASQ